MKTPVELMSSVADRETNITGVSGARASMVGGHMKSAVPLDEPQPSAHFTGADVNYHDYCFNDIVEDSGTVCSYTTKEGVTRAAVFARYGREGDHDPRQHVIFFKRTELTNQRKVMIDVIDINYYTSHDNIFSSRKSPTGKLQALLRGQTQQLEKDEMLTTLPAQLDGEFVDGVSLPTVTMSHPDIIEDSYTLSETAAASMHASGIRIIDFTLRDDEYLLDIYGTTQLDGTRRPQYMPGVGKAVRDDGLVLAARRFDKLWAAIDSHVGETQHASPHFDRCEYVDADPEHYKANLANDIEKLDLTGSRVVDIQVWRDETKCDRGTNNIACTEENKRELDHYANALKRFYNDVVRFYFAMSKDKNIVWSPKAFEILDKAFSSETYEVYSEFREEIGREYEEAMRKGEYNRSADKNVLNKLAQPVQRGLWDPIGSYTIRIVVRYPIPVTVSSKITDRSGTKGIVGAVRPDHEMPINEFGERVHVIRSMNAVIRRSTYAALFHMYWSAASEQLKMRLQPILAAGQIEEAWSILMDYIDRYNPKWTFYLNASHNTVEAKRELFKEIYDFTIRIWLPHELDDTQVEICQRLGEYAPRKSKLLITNYQGEKEWTKNQFYVGSVETLRLDKTGREFSSISSMYTNFLGSIDASNQGRGSYPINLKSLKWGGPSEQRLTDGFGPGNFPETHDRANNPAVHRAIVTGMFNSKTPTNPGVLIDRKKMPLGDSQIDRMIRNIHICEGFQLVRPIREKK
ncbi:putative DNA-directed RNA polymerase beta subunit 1 [Salmonella phage SPAsTU]|nr:putative DNA-directed RNA polymerase beta subunit 2 [Salmonella phage STsAS]AWN09061.1 putative DNA-directed RNA polymerase beta subunit 1 [Salmonella phage SPAsTU]